MCNVYLIRFVHYLQKRFVKEAHQYKQHQFCGQCRCVPVTMFMFTDNKSMADLLTLLKSQIIKGAIISSQSCSLNHTSEDARNN